MITKITFWCQKVLPVEFDDSLSYYETLCKVVEKLNEVVDNTNKAFNQLETDVNAELNKKQDTLVSGENIKTVNGESVLGSGNININGGGTEVEGNPTGGATDGDLIKIKIGGKIYNIHDYTDAINGKLDKVTNATTYIQVYGKGAAGGQTMINATSDTVGLIMLRDANKCASVGTPTKNTHIANKGYVDGAVSGKQDTLVSGTNIKTVNGESILGSGNINIATGTVVEGNPTGDATDGDLIKIKIGSKIYNIHDYTDAINGKLDKVTSTSSFNRVYSIEPSGIQQILIATPKTTSISIVLRDANGRANIAEPIEDANIANKLYVDNAISGKQDTLVSGTNIKTINGNSVLGSGNISIETGVVEMPTISGSFSGSEQNHYTVRAQKIGWMCNLFISVDFNPTKSNESQSFNVTLPTAFTSLDSIFVKEPTNRNAHWENGCWDACSSIINGWMFDAIVINPSTNMLMVGVRSASDYHAENGLYKMSFRVAE